MAVYTTAGTRLFIGPPLTVEIEDFDATDFPAIGSADWVEIGETESLGSIGDTSAEVAFSAINRPRAIRRKGTRTAAAMEVVCGRDADDPGQQAAIAAEKEKFDYAILLVLNDAPTVGGTGSARMFSASIANATEQFDTADSIIKLNLSFWINSNVVRIAAGA